MPPPWREVCGRKQLGCLKCSKRAPTIWSIMRRITLSGFSCGDMGGGGTNFRIGRWVFFAMQVNCNIYYRQYDQTSTLSVRTRQWGSISNRERSESVKQDRLIVFVRCTLTSTEASLCRTHRGSTSVLGPFPCCPFTILPAQPTPPVRQELPISLLFLSLCVCCRCHHCWRVVRVGKQKRIEQAKEENPYSGSKPLSCPPSITSYSENIPVVLSIVVDRSASTRPNWSSTAVSNQHCGRGQWRR